MLKTLKNRRGIAIESAITFMVIIFAMVTIIGTVAAFSSLDRRRADSDFAENVIIENIGEQFAKNPRDYTGGEPKNGFKIEKTDNSENGYTLTVKKGENVVLVVKTNKDGKVIRWSNYDDSKTDQE